MFSFKSKGTTRRVTEPKDQSFSTSEINTGTTWIDGSTIYKKSVLKFMATMLRSLLDKIMFFMIRM